MNDFVRALARAVDSESPREDRARTAAQLVRDERGYRWVGIYDVGDAESELIGTAGSTAHDEALRTGRSIAGSGCVVVPILGAESGIVIGTLDAECDRPNLFTDADVAFLEQCAAVLRPLYD